MLNELDDVAAAKAAGHQGDWPIQIEAATVIEQKAQGSMPRIAFIETAFRAGKKTCSWLRRI